MARREVATAILFLLVAVELVAGDVYLHTPRGSNDRVCERNDARQNGNRLFDSENNAQGGYACPGDPAYGDTPQQDFQIFYVGSHLRVEWTSQHAAGGNARTTSQTILQVGCEEQMPGIRDPVAQGDIVDAENDGTTGQFFRREWKYNPEVNGGFARIPLPNEINNLTPEGEEPLIPEDPDDPDYEQAVNDFYMATPGTRAGEAGAEFGLHENYEYYARCRNRERYNYWISDQDLGNLQTATAVRTRQEPNENRHGLECPEERDYYPYNSPSPWIDVAIFTSDTEHCEYYQMHSQNVEERGRCLATRENGRIPNNEADCNAISQGMWEVIPSHAMLMPTCHPHPYARDNHLGATLTVDEDGDLDLSLGAPTMAHFDWTIPEWMQDQKCALRIRYNISTLDNMPHEYLSDDGTVTGADQNCDPDTDNEGGQREGETKCECLNKIEEDCVPLYTDPYVQYLSGDDTHELAINLNGNQNGRGFQDRSYVFKVDPMPENMKGTVWNLMVRGRRGNIVQAFPGLEYDFSGKIVDEQALTQGDWIVYNYCGTWFNPNNNNEGNGNGNMDGSNICALDTLGENFPMHESRLEDSLFKDNVDNGIYRELCTPPFYPPKQGEFASCTEYSCCRTYLDAVVNGEQNRDDFEDDIRACAYLNHMDPCFQTAFQVNADAGQEYAIVGTRNNDFSNRSQKAGIYVGSSLSAGAIAGIVIASVAVAGAGVGFGVYKFRTRAVSGNSAV